MTDLSRGWVLVIDEMTGDFTVEGPAPNIEHWKAAVGSAQSAGRKVGLVVDEGTREEAVAQAKHQFGGKELFEAGSIVSLD